LTFDLILEQGNSTMATTHQDKPGGKPRQGKGKAEQRSRKPDQQQSPKPDQRRGTDQTGATMASPAASTHRTVAPVDAPSTSVAAPVDAPSIGDVAPVDAPSIGAAALEDASSIGDVAPVDAPSIGAAAPADNVPVSMQTIANAYSDYTRKSLEETTSFVEKLTGVRSLDKAIEIQAEFAKQAYETFVAESQRICELYGELARQIFKPFAGLLAKATHSGR
jgi:phasin family protein